MRNASEMIAFAMEVDPVLLPHLPELLEGLEQLGTDPDLIVEVIGALGLPDGSRVVDLGCGKGAVSIAVASRLGLPVLGIDLFEPFVDHCERAAAAAGVGHLCTFRQGDIRLFAARNPCATPADVAVFGALGDVLGSLESTVGILRQYVREDGIVLIGDDHVRSGDSVDFPGFENYRSRSETIRQLTAHGDKIVHFVEESDADLAAAHLRANEIIRARAEKLAARHPGLRDVFLGYADDQEAETAFLEREMVSVIWVLQRIRDPA